MDGIERLIYGERPEDLWPGLRRIFGMSSRRTDGRYQWTGDLTGPAELPLLRALHRAEAELLLEEAQALLGPDVRLSARAERQGVAIGRIAEQMPVAAGQDRPIV